MTGNASLIVPGFGQRACTVTGIRHGIKFTSQESEARHHKSMYPLFQDTGEFDLRIKFAKLVEYRSFLDWIISYTKKMSDPNTSTIAMRVLVPARKFDKTGVPTSGIQYECSVKDVTWTLNLTFAGVEDALSFSSPLLSSFRLATNQAAESQYFYPAGIQLDSNDRLKEDMKRVNDSLTVENPKTPVKGPF